MVTILWKFYDWLYFVFCQKESSCSLHFVSSDNWMKYETFFKSLNLYFRAYQIYLRQLSNQIRGQFFQKIQQRNSINFWWTSFLRCKHLFMNNYFLYATENPPSNFFRCVKVWSISGTSNSKRTMFWESVKKKFVKRNADWHILLKFILCQMFLVLLYRDWDR